MTDNQRMKMDHRLGCFVTKSQAKKLDTMDFDYLDYLINEDDGELIVGLSDREVFMDKRGRVTTA